MGKVFEVARWLILWKVLFIPADIKDFSSEEVLLDLLLLYKVLTEKLQ